MAPLEGLSSWLEDRPEASKPPPAAAEAAEALPMVVSAGERPRGKAKAKSKVMVLRLTSVTNIVTSHVGWRM